MIKDNPLLIMPLVFVLLISALFLISLSPPPSLIRNQYPIFQCGELKNCLDIPK